MNKEILEIIKPFSASCRGELVRSFSFDENQTGNQVPILVRIFRNERGGFEAVASDLANDTQRMYYGREADSEIESVQLLLVDLGTHRFSFE